MDQTVIAGACPLSGFQNGLVLLLLQNHRTLAPNHQAETTVSVTTQQSMCHTITTVPKLHDFPACARISRHSITSGIKAARVDTVAALSVSLSYYSDPVHV